MLMIHAGPLYSALQMTPPSPTSAEHHHVSHDHAQSAAAHARSQHGHHRSTSGQPAWLTALEMCGYCELLTLNPPLVLAIQLLLPQHQPERIQPLPDAELRQAPYLHHRYARGPPVHFHS